MHPDDSFKENMSQESRSSLFIQGTIKMLPLSIAVVPWGILAGSFAIDSGLTPMEGQAFSLILFAGAAQLVAMGMIKAGTTLGALVVTIFFITSRHFLYSVAMRDKISPLPGRWRVVLGFLLTDELFAFCGSQTPKQFKPWYAFGAGLSFYLIWNVATFAGIVAGSTIPNLNELGLEFAVAATFIGIVVPTVKNRPVLVSVFVALVLSVYFAWQQVEGGLVIASVIAMISGYLCERLEGKA
ncbi:putative branched-chain amino acid permease (azaleucine resistance) [Vibrio nigripulchritudo]|uniref:Putative branched-chain amino acid permease (Azaleucine resistance) n=2 Tax=Vibrio nigripulchritudo TaxID=28173 RepID=U4KDJ1_9VIBR|nr:putative branched-chain amino acid permease (azaleucine resistance) [Vibrio nigripulchritudo]